VLQAWLLVADIAGGGSSSAMAAAAAAADRLPGAPVPHMDEMVDWITKNGAGQPAMCRAVDVPVGTGVGQHQRQRMQGSSTAHGCSGLLRAAQALGDIGSNQHHPAALHSFILLS